MREAKIVDMAINKIARTHFRKQAYRATKTYELHQFASLFNTEHLNKLAKLLFISDRHVLGNMHTYHYAVDVGWIDKKPIAEYAAQSLFERVELGDALILYNNHLIDSSWKYLGTVHERAVIIQAKITKNKSRQPKVTVTFGDSSNKEFALYSRWPTFRLKRRKSYTQKFNLPALNYLKNPYPYAFYLAARKSYSRHSNWPCHWMGAPSQLSEKCDISTGELLLALKSGMLVNGYQVGAELNSNPEWARLVRLILMAVGLGWTNRGWSGRTIPTRMQGTYLQLVTQHLPTLIQKKYYTNFLLSLNQSLFKQTISGKHQNNITSNQYWKDPPQGKFMVLRITKISSEFTPESENFFER
ncbi:hypothetical protein [Klebsiella pneumoniae]|uniref:hypothetical protein n=2 Tax=Klebsiella pneumoniae complex TaxID=3390273 RepID=UPI002243C07A|nr:hypothetical protein [Klebsiella pneumoniae]